MVSLETMGFVAIVGIMVDMGIIVSMVIMVVTVGIDSR